MGFVSLLYCLLIYKIIYFLSNSSIRDNKSPSSSDFTLVSSPKLRFGDKDSTLKVMISEVLIEPFPSGSDVSGKRLIILNLSLASILEDPIN